MERLLKIKDQEEFNRNSAYTTAFNRFHDLLTMELKIHQYYDDFQKTGQNLREYSKYLDIYQNLPFWDSLVTWRSEKKIKNQDVLAIETGILFLEADPYFIQSGYCKEVILEQLKQIDLTPYILRLQNALLSVVDTHYCREFRYYCKLAPKLDSEEFRNKLRSRLDNPDPNVGQRAQWVLDFLTKYSKYNGNE